MNIAASSHGSSTPLHAPCRKLAPGAPWGWLRKGWQDFRRAPWHSLAYGLAFTAMGWLLVYLSWIDRSYLFIGLLAGLLVIGPALAFGLYDVSWQLERNLTPSFRHERSKAFHEMGHELMLALWLTLAFLVLVLGAAAIIDMFVAPSPYPVYAAVPLPDSALLAVALVFGVLLFCVSAFALPMIMDRDASAVTAIATSLHAVWHNRAALALWALIVLVLAVIGLATALVGFLVIAPVLGYATWQAYRETILPGGGTERDDSP